MTTPQHGAPQQPTQGPYPQQSYPQQSYPQQQLYPQQQPYAGQPAGYGAPPVYGAAPARPGMVTAAAVLAFIWGGLAILFALISLLVGGAVNSVSGIACNSPGLDPETAAACNSVSGVGGFLIIAGILMIIVAGLMIWGGVVALSGKSSQILVIAGGVMIVVAIVNMIAGAGIGSAIFSVIIPILIIAFLMNGTSKAWFKTKGGKTF